MKLEGNRFQDRAKILSPLLNEMSHPATIENLVNRFVKCK